MNGAAEGAGWIADWVHTNPVKVKISLKYSHNPHAHCTHMHSAMGENTFFPIAPTK